MADKVYGTGSWTDQRLADEGISGTLDEIVALCKEHDADCTLYDDRGFVRGWVYADGTWRLQ